MRRTLVATDSRRHALKRERVQAKLNAGVFARLLPAREKSHGLWLCSNPACPRIAESYRMRDGNSAEAIYDVTARYAAGVAMPDWMTRPKADLGVAAPPLRVASAGPPQRLRGASTTARMKAAQAANVGPG